MAVAFHSQCGCITAPDRGVRLLHILREVPRRQSYRAHAQFRAPTAEVGWCGTGAWGHRHDITPLPSEPPAGLTWCGACVGRYAAHTGQIAALAAQLVDHPSPVRAVAS